MQELAIDAARVAPPVAVVAANTVFGVPLQEWVLILTAIYTVIQIGITLYNFFKPRVKASGS